MAYQTTWRQVEQIDTNCRPTKKGDPQISIKTDKGEWIKISGEGILQVRVGQKIEISEPAQFGKSWYARLQAIDTTPAKQEPKEQAPASNGNGYHAAEKMNQDVGGAAFDFWAGKVNQLAEWTPEAKASVLCTLMIATFDGRIQFQMPGETEEEAPF